MPHPTTTAHLWSTFYEDDKENNIITERSRLPDGRRRTTRTTRTISHSNVLSNNSSRRSSPGTASSHRIKHEDSTDGYSFTTDDIESTTDKEGQSSHQTAPLVAKFRYFVVLKVENIVR